MIDEKINYLRSRKNDDQLSPTQFRTYIDSYVIYFIFLFILLLCLVGFSLQIILSFPFFKFSLWFITRAKELKEWGIYDSLSAKFSVIYCSIIFVSGYVAHKLNRAVNYSQVKKDGQKYYAKNGLDEYKSEQSVARNENDLETNLLKKEFDKNELHLDYPTRELALFVTGEAGSGKTVLLNRFLEDYVDKGEKAILHDPKLDFTKALVKADTSVAVIAPWIDNPACKYIDYAKLIYSDNIELTKLMIDLFVYSFAGFKNPKKPDFFDDNSKVVLIALTRKVVDIYKDKWLLIDWVKVVEENLDVDKIIDVVKQYCPESSFLLDKDNPKTTGSILASMVQTIIKIKQLAILWKDCKKPFDLKDWLFSKKPKYQFITLVNSKTYQDVASSVIASFINLATKLVLDPEYLQGKPALLHFTLDEFNSFARYIDLANFKELMDLGRQALIRVEIAQQRQTQAYEYITDQKQAEDFLGAFQNRIYCRPANSDFDLIKNQIGPHTEIQQEASKSYNAQGHNMTFKTVEKQVQFEPSVLTTQLGPKPAKGKGVYVALNTVSNPVVARVLIPFKTFCSERIDLRKANGTYKNREFKEKIKSFSREVLEIENLILEKIKLEEKIEEVKISGVEDKQRIIDETNKKLSVVISQLNELMGIEPIEEPKEEKSLVEGVAKEMALDSLDHTGALTLINQANELLESFEDINDNVDAHNIEEKEESVRTRKKTIIREVER